VHSPTNLHEQAWCIFFASINHTNQGVLLFHCFSLLRDNFVVMCAAVCHLLIVSARRLSSAFESVTMPVHIFGDFMNLDIHFSASCCLLLSVACFAFSLLYDHHLSLLDLSAFANKLTQTSLVQFYLLLQYQSHKPRCFAFPLLFTHHLRAFERTNLHEQSWPARILNHSPPPMTRTGNPTLPLVHLLHQYDSSEFRNSFHRLSCF